MAISDPRDIPGLVLYLSAGYEAANYSDGQAMTGWTNLVDNTQVPAGKVTTTGATNPTWEATTGASGGPAVNFANYGLFDLPDVLAGTTSDTGATAIATVKSAINAAQGNWLRYSGSNDQLYYPQNTTPRIYDDFMNQRNWFDSTLSVTAWRRVDIRSGGDTGASPVYTSGDTQDYRIDGTVQTYLFAKRTWSGPANTYRRLGNSTYGAPVTTQRWQGRLGCVLLWNRALTPTERADVNTWLAANPSGGVPAAPPPTASVSLTGTGGAAAQGKASPAASVALTGTGDLAAQGKGGPTASVSLTSTGSLAAQGSQGALSVALTGTGGLTVLATPDFAAQVTRSGDGTLTCTGTVTGEAFFTGGGTLKRRLPDPKDVTVLIGSTRVGSIDVAGSRSGSMTVDATRIGSIAVDADARQDCTIAPTRKNRGM